MAKLLEVAMSSWLLLTSLLILQWQVLELQALPSREDYNVSGTNTTVTLGGLFAVTSSIDGACAEKIDEGPFANVEAMIFAVDTINADPKILPDITLTYDIRDTCGLSNVALEETIHLMDIEGSRESGGNRISGVVGAALSDVSISVASLLRIFHMPQISHSSTATVLDDRERFDYFFRTIPPDSLQAKAMADLIVYFNWTYIIALNTDDTYGRGGISSLIQELNRENGSQVCVVTEPEITNIPLNADTSHYERVVEFMTENWVINSSVVVFFGQRKAAIRLLNAAGDLPRDYFTWIASDAWATRVPPEHRNTVRGMLGLVPRVHHLESFVKHFESLNQSNDSANPWLEKFWEQKFNCSFSESGAPPCTGDEHLSLVNTTESNGVTYVVDAVYAFAYAIESMIRSVCSDSCELCSNATVKRFSQTVLNGTKLRDHLYDVAFMSLTSHQVSFEVDEDRQGAYNVVNLGEDEQRKIGTWDNINRLQITADVYWRGGEREVPMSQCSCPCGAGQYPALVPEQSSCCWTCEACVGERTVSTGEECTVCWEGTHPNDVGDRCVPNPITFLKWSDPWSVVILLFTTFGLAVTAFVVAVYIIFNKEKIIKATSRELSAILLTGISLCYVLPFIFVAPPSPTICALRRSGIGICFSLCFSPLLMKTNRIYRIFHQAPRTPRYAGPRSQVVFTCCLICVQVVIAILWLALERPSVVEKLNRDTTERLCGESPYIGLPLSLIYNIFLLVLATFYAFLAREIPAKFNEGKFIAVTLYTICIIWLGFFPTYIGTIKFGSIYQTVSLVFAVLFSASTTLACLFIPKVVLLFRQKLKEKVKGKTKKNIERFSVDTRSTDADITLDYALRMQESATTG